MQTGLCLILSGAYPGVCVNGNCGGKVRIGGSCLPVTKTMNGQNDQHRGHLDN